jgi:L-lactate utilization protein LutB
MAFVEVKGYGMKPRPLQIKQHGMLKKLGFKVYVLDDKKEIQRIVSEIMGGDAR